MWGGPACEEVDVELPDSERGHINVLRNFARNILCGEELLTPGQDGIHSLELANAVWLSASRKAPVTLPLDRDAYDEFLAAKRRESTFEKGISEDVRVTDPHHRIGSSQA